jgi:H+/Cl- antiporter ClcA
MSNQQINSGSLLHRLYRYISVNQLALRSFFFKWLAIVLALGILIGLASFLFLASLSWATQFRESHQWMIMLLPVAGFIVGLLYHYYGNEANSGNNLLINAVHFPTKTKIPFIIAPLIFSGTIITHLFGGSAGREGTALQMASGIAYQFNKLVKLDREEKSILILVAIAAGFSAVFGTPLAGAVFSLEVFLIRKLNFKAIVPVFATAFIADTVCRLCNAAHTHYSIGNIPKIDFSNFIYIVIGGIAFGICANIFGKSIQWLSAQFKHWISYPPLRPLIGGLIILLAVWALNTTRYLGLGIPVISESFLHPLSFNDFSLKMIFTLLTLAAGFKGGEVTPLFFIGATLGSWLSYYLGLPVGLMAAMGFVAVFAGATNTPFACTVMACELFGLSCFPFVFLACIIAYFLSGNKSIYDHKLVGKAKFKKYALLQRKKLKAL